MIFGNALLKIIEVILGRGGGVNYVLVGVIVFYFALNIYRIAISKVLKFVDSAFSEIFM